MKKVWRIAEEFPRYEVSNEGELRNRKTLHVHKGCVDKGGYRQLCLKDASGRSRSVLLHRLVAKAFIPNPENKPQVNHKDFNGLNNSVENLEWVTEQENHDHKMEHGRNVAPEGEGHGMAKLKESDVVDIYTLIKEGSLTQKEIARRYGISSSTVSHIKTGRLWKKTTDELQEGLL